MHQREKHKGAAPTRKTFQKPRGIDFLQIYTKHRFVIEEAGRESSPGCNYRYRYDRSPFIDAHGKQKLRGHAGIIYL